VIPLHDRQVLELDFQQGLGHATLKTCGQIGVSSTEQKERLDIALKAFERALSLAELLEDRETVDSLRRFLSFHRSFQSSLDSSSPSSSSSSSGDISPLPTAIDDLERLYAAIPEDDFERRASIALVLGDRYGRADDLVTCVQKLNASIQYQERRGSSMAALKAVVASGTNILMGIQEDGTAVRSKGRAALFAFVESCKMRLTSQHGCKFCSLCGKTNEQLMNDNNNSEKFLRCGRCKAALYCNQACQKKHWPHHKNLCKEPKNS